VGIQVWRSVSKFTPRTAGLPAGGVVRGAPDALETRPAPSVIAAPAAAEPMTNVRRLIRAMP
jgi:hypothetical protein